MKDVVSMMGFDDERWRMHEGNGFGWVMVVMMLIIAIAVVVAVVALLRGQSTAAPARPAVPGGGATDARRILQERFARGDIDESEYRSRIQALDDTSTGG